MKKNRVEEIQRLYQSSQKRITIYQDISHVLSKIFESGYFKKLVLLLKEIEAEERKFTLKQLANFSKY